MASLRVVLMFTFWKEFKFNIISVINTDSKAKMSNTTYMNRKSSWTVTEVYKSRKFWYISRILIKFNFMLRCLPFYYGDNIKCPSIFAHSTCCLARTFTTQEFIRICNLCAFAEIVYTRSIHTNASWKRTMAVFRICMFAEEEMWAQWEKYCK